MIAYIRGEIVQIGLDYAVIDNQGIGYRIYMPGSALDRLSSGMETKIHTYHHVREDAMTLFGFLSSKDLEMFRLLIGVNGIGPRAALGILSAFSAEELQFAVLADDVKALTKAPGIGKKTAQKLILELKDKMNLEQAFEDKLSSQNEESQPQAGNDAGDEVVQALVALGYSPGEALKSVRQIEITENMDTKQILKLALKSLI